MSQPLVFMPGTPFRVTWNHFVFAGISWFVFTVPFFLLPFVNDNWEIVEKANLLWSAFFLADILVNMHTAHLEDGEYITNLKMIRNSYRRFWFFPDLVAAIPWDVIAFWSGFPGWVPFLSMLRLACLSKVFRLSRTYTSGWPPTIHGGSFLLLFWIFFGVCWIAVIWLFLTPPDGTRPMYTEVVEAIYWAVTTLTSTGYGDILPKTEIPRLFAASVMMSGVVMISLVVGNVVSLVANINAQRTKAMERINQLSSMLRQYPMPEKLEEELSSYYRHLMTHSEDAQSDFLSQLPTKLQTRLFNHVTGHLLKQVAMFADASPELLLELTGKLRKEVYMPREEIITCGHPGNEMYFLIHGTVAVLTGDGKFLAKIRMNSAFGETALLYDQPRTATIRAMTFCSVFKLEKDDFNRVINNHPQFRTRLEEIARARGAKK